MVDSYHNGVVRRPVHELHEGDRVDLECDVYADNGEHPEFEFEFQVVALKKKLKIAL